MNLYTKDDDFLNDYISINTILVEWLVKRLLRRLIALKKIRRHFSIFIGLRSKETKSKVESQIYSRSFPNLVK